MLLQLQKKEQKKTSHIISKTHSTVQLKKKDESKVEKSSTKPRSQPGSRRNSKSSRSGSKSRQKFRVSLGIDTCMTDFSKGMTASMVTFTEARTPKFHREIMPDDKQYSGYVPESPHDPHDPSPQSWFNKFPKKKGSKVFIFPTVTTTTTTTTATTTTTTSVTTTTTTTTTTKSGAKGRRLTITIEDNSTPKSR